MRQSVFLLSTFVAGAVIITVLNSQLGNYVRQILYNGFKKQEKVMTIRRMSLYDPKTFFIDTGEYKCHYEQGRPVPFGADLLLFAGGDVQRIKKPPYKGAKDLWAFFSKEAPIKLKAQSIQSKWDGLFNYSATYHRDNAGNIHIFRPELVPLSPLRSDYFTPKPTMRPLRMMWFVSHCTNPPNFHNIYSAREEYVLELSKYIHIDIYTSPLLNVCDSTLQRFKNVQRKDDANMADYMFYLSFENNICKDYITEKLWKVLESNSTTIPVALGGLSIEDYEAVAPSNSFIHVKNFTSPEALANHLKFVSQHDKAFNYYHQWRNHFDLDTSHHVMNNNRSYMYYGDFMNYFCKLAHERPQRVWNTFSEDYNKNQCVDVSNPQAYCVYYNLTCAGKLLPT